MFEIIYDEICVLKNKQLWKFSVTYMTYMLAEGVVLKGVF